MSRFHLVTAWRIEAPIDAVWGVLVETETWPKWWPYVEAVDMLEKGGADGLGARQRLTWRTRLPYKLSFDAHVTALDKPITLEATVSGELEGSGRWRLTDKSHITEVRYDWDVRTTKRWMRWAAPLARPVFAWNHHYVMERGGEGLARELGARFLGMDR